MKFKIILLLFVITAITVAILYWKKEKECNLAYASDELKSVVRIYSSPRNTRDFISKTPIDYYTISMRLENAIQSIDMGDKTCLEDVEKIYGTKILQYSQMPISDLINLSNSGDRYAQYVISKRYKSGLLIEKNRRESGSFLKKSAENKLPVALRDLAWVTHINSKLISNPAEDWLNKTLRFMYFSEAATLGDAISMNATGVLYYYGDGCEKNHYKSQEFFTKSLKSKNPIAISSTAQFYLTNYEKLDDLFKMTSNYGQREAYESINNIAGSGNRFAQRSLADLFWNNKIPKGFYNNTNQLCAIKWYRKAASQGDGTAQRFLGELYATGDFVPKNRVVAENYLASAAENNAYSPYLLGLRFLRGDGVEKNHDHAARFFKMAAFNGNAEAQYELGQCYWNGRGVQKNLILAYVWISLASNKSDYALSLAMLSKKLTSENINDAEKLGSGLFDRIQIKMDDVEY
jgi:TPR repeat protein